MNEYSLEGKTGFSILCESQTWRIACHVYEESVNGVTAIANWGMHLDSQETFTLLQGKGYLALKLQNNQVDLKVLEKNRVYVVECGEPHILVLTDESKVLITENQNMENSIIEPATDDEINIIKNFLREEI